MAKKGKSTKILGAIAFASTALFMFESRKNPDNTKIEGLNMDIDPEKMIDSIKEYISPNKKINEAVASVVKKKLAKLLNG